MTHPSEALLRRAYTAFNEGNVEGFMAAFAVNAVLHGADADVRGRPAIRAVVEQLREMAGGTLHIEVHDVLANDEHAVVLQVTRAERAGRVLADRVAYVFHLRDGLVTDAWFQGDPRIQDEFWSA